MIHSSIDHATSVNLSDEDYKRELEGEATNCSSEKKNSSSKGIWYGSSAEAVVEARARAIPNIPVTINSSLE